jgi:hypothetical protein
MKIKLFIVMILLGCSAFAASAGLTSSLVQSQGSGVTREDAINAALIEAVSQVNGAAIASTVSTSVRESFTETNSGESYDYASEMQEQISKATSGIVKSWSIQSVGPDPQLESFWVAVLNVEVAQYKQSQQLKRLRMAVSNFWYQAGGADANDLAMFGKAFARELENLLTQTRKFAMLDRSFQKDQQQERDLISGGGVPTEELAKLGQQAGADYIVVGEVTSAKKSSVKRTMQTTGQEVTVKSAEGSVDYRLIDIATGQVKFAATQRGEVSSTSVGAAARAAAALAAEKILNAIYPITVIAIDDTAITLNQGGDVLKAGDLYQLMLLGDVLRDPYTKERLGRSENKIGMVKITAVQAKMATANIEEINIAIDPAGPLPAMIVRPTPKPSKEQSEQAKLKRAQEEGQKKVDSILTSSEDDW